MLSWRTISGINEELDRNFFVSGQLLGISVVAPASTDPDGDPAIGACRLIVGNRPPIWIAAGTELGIGAAEFRAQDLRLPLDDCNTYDARCDMFPGNVPVEIRILGSETGADPSWVPVSWLVLWADGDTPR